MNCAGRLSLVCFLLATVCVQADTIADGNAAFAKSDFPAAIRAFESVLATHGPSAGLYYSLGMAQQKDGQHAQAALNFRRAIMLDPGMVDARMALSEIERSQAVPSVPANWREFVAEHAPLKALLIAGCVLAWLGAFLFLFVVFARAGRLFPIVGAVGLVAAGTGLFCDWLPGRSACCRSERGRDFGKGRGYASFGTRGSVSGDRAPSRRSVCADIEAERGVGFL